MSNNDIRYFLYAQGAQKEVSSKSCMRPARKVLNGCIDSVDRGMFIFRHRNHKAFLSVDHLRFDL